MNVFVAGATGRVGQRVVDQLIKNENKVYAGARKEDLITRRDRVIPVHLDLKDNQSMLEKTMKDAEALIFTAGSRGKDLLKVDLYGAVKMMKAAKALNIRRFIMLSAAFSLEPDQWEVAMLKDIKDYMIAKHFADLWLMNESGLDYTILQPCTLTEEKGSGKIGINDGQVSKNSIDNVADVLVELLDRKETIGRTIMMHDGNMPINEALEKCL